MKNKLLLSIIIPTKNREMYLKNAIISICERLDSNDFEIVVFDSGIVSNLSVWIKELNQSNILYIYSPKTKGFCETFSKAVSYATGDYVCIIGDDDCILSSVLEITRYAKNNNIDAITPLNQISYRWPDFLHSAYGKNEAGTLISKKFTGKLEKVSVKSELLKSAKSGFQNFSRIPRIYYGIVRRTCLEEIKTIYGDYFVGSSPDISGAIALANVVISFYIIDYPIFLPGASAPSGAGRSGSGNHAGDIKDEPWVSKFADIWPSQVPYVFSVQTMWAQSAIFVLQIYDKYKVVDEFSVDKLFARTLVFNLQFWKKLMLWYLGQKRRYYYMEGTIYTLLEFSQRMFRFFKNTLRFNRLDLFLYEKDVKNTKQAALIIEKKLLKTKSHLLIDKLQDKSREMHE